MKGMVFALLVLLVGTPSMALGQDDAPVPTPDLPPDVARNLTRYRFEDELVAGDLVRPDGEILQVHSRKPSASLVRSRQHFVPEMLKSVENI